MNTSGLPPYVELRAHTAFSFGDGAVTPEALIRRAVALGYRGIGITDTTDLGGIVRAKLEADQQGIQLIAGAELRVEGRPLAVLARTHVGCQNLAALITESRVGHLKSWSRNNPGQVRGMPNLTWEQLQARNAGLHLLTGPASGTLATLLRNGQRSEAERFVYQWRDIFEGRFAIEVQHHFTGGDESALAGALVELATRTKTPWVVTNDPRYLDEDSRLIHDILTALRCGTTLDDAAARGMLHPNGMWRLRSPHEMAATWKGCEAGLEESARIASECNFDVRWLRPPLPKFVKDVPDHKLQALLRKHVYEGARIRWGDPLEKHYVKQLDHELEIIERLGFAGFFLVMWDAVRYAREERNILCQGRGSAANSAVAYCLQITAVDPVENGLLFERFLSDVRVDTHKKDGTPTHLRYTEAPDIDVDIEHTRREEVLDYVYEHYGREHSAITCIVQTYGAPNAALDSMRALGYPAELGFALSKRLRRHRSSDGETLIDEKLAKRIGLDLSTPRGKTLLRAMHAFKDLPRLRSTHVGGFVLSGAPIGEYLPVEHTTMGRTIIQFDKDDLDVIGVPKFDFLGLGALSLVRHSFDAIEKRTGTKLELYSIPPDDPDTFAMIARGDTLGTFQIESRAQIASILQTRPEKMYDIVVQIALVRPGPIQGKFVHPYTRRRRGDEDIVYLHPALESILKRTQGIPIFQEQAMRISIELGNFQPAQADELRRCMGNSKKKERLATILATLKQQMLANTELEVPITPEQANQIEEDLMTFSNYGFPESHAWSFAYIAYATAYLKRHYPTDFYLGILNAQPMGFYPISTLIHDARRHGVEIRPPCLRDGDYLCTTIPTDDPKRPILRIGWRYIRGVSRNTLDRLQEARKAAPFTSIADIVQRISIKRSEVLQLARAGAFEAWEPDRRRAAWEGLRAVGDRFALAPTRTQPYFPRPLTKQELVFMDYDATGMCLTGHPMEHLRERVRRAGALDSREVSALRGGESVIVAGLVTVRQRPGSANGIIFLLLEDEFGFINVIVPQRITHQHSEAVKFASFVVVQGKFQRDGPVTNVIASRVRELRVQTQLTHSAHSFH